MTATAYRFQIWGIPVTKPVITSAASMRQLQQSLRIVSIKYRLNQVVKLLLVSASLQLAVVPVQAITEADALKKLAVVPVFVLTDSKGVPLPIAKDKTLVLPLYLERAKAEAELAILQKANPSLLAKLVAIPLNDMSTKVKQLQLQLKDKGRTLVAPVISSPADRQQAGLMLKQQGFSDKKIQEGLAVPVFFTKPFLSLAGTEPAGKATAPAIPKLMFFMSYASLQAAIAKVPPAKRASLEPQVADLSAVLRQIIQSPQDRYVIFPTADYFQLVQKQPQFNQQRPDPKAQPQRLSPSQTPVSQPPGPAAALPAK